MSAHDRAVQTHTGSSVRWDRLERGAFAAHPEVLERRRVPAWQRAVQVVLIAVWGTLSLAPVWGFAAIGRSGLNSFDNDAAVWLPRAGMLYVVALVVLVAATAHWLSSGRRKIAYVALQSWLTLILGLLTAAAIRIRGVEDSVAGWQTWMYCTFAAVVWAAVLVGVVPFTSRFGPAEITAHERTLLATRRERVMRLSDLEREAVRADLTSAIDDLQQRA